MPVKVTKEEKMVELAILKAKEFLQYAGHLGTVELEDDSEDVKVKRPKENPKEKKLDNPTGDGYGEVSGDAYHKSIMTNLKYIDEFCKAYGGRYSELDPKHSESNPIIDDEMSRAEETYIRDLHSAMSEVARELQSAQWSEIPQARQLELVNILTEMVEELKLDRGFDDEGDSATPMPRLP